MTTTVLVVDDHAAVRHAVYRLLSSAADIDVIGEAADADSAVALAEQLAPDVVLMDVGLGVSNGIEATRRIGEVAGGCRVIGFSVHDDRPLVTEMMAAGAVGYLRKDVAGEELPAAIRAVAAGGRYFGQGLER